MDPRGTTGTEITAIDSRNTTRITTETRESAASIGISVTGRRGGSKRECPATEERNERSEKVRITLSFLMFSAAYNLQMVRYRRACVPDGEPPRDNGLGREDTSEEGEI